MEYRTMFLGRIRFAAARGDEGVAMVAVIGMMAVGLLLSSLIMASVIHGVGYTSSTKAGVQSQASAEAGVAAAVAGLKSGKCTLSSGIYKSATGTSPQYSAKIYSQTALGNWSQSCPVAGTTAVKVLSEGTAAALGVAGQSGNDEAKVEALFSTEPQDTSILATGPAVYAYSSQGFSGSGTLVSADGTTSNVMVKEGDVNCSGGAGLAADLIVNAGNLALSGSCNVDGNVWVSGSITLSGGVRVSGNIVAGSVSIPNGKVGGSVWSNGTTSLGSSTIGGNVYSTGATTLSSTTLTTGSVFSSSTLTLGGSSKVAASAISAGNMVLSGGDTISGSAWSGGDISTTWGGLIAGNATAKTITMGGGDVKGMSWASSALNISGWYQISGSAKTKVANISNGPTPRYLGGLTVVSSGPGAGPTPPTPATATAAPLIPIWVDFVYQESDWTGFSFATVSGSCNYSAFQTAVDSFGGQPGVIDARGCSSAISISSYQAVVMSNDLAIIGKSFDLGGSASFTSSSHHKLWFITPDTTDDDKPTCVTGDFKIGGGFKFSTTLDVMVYTPCKVSISSGIKWRGQVFGGKVTVDGAAQLTFVPVGLPNIDLATGLATTEDTATTNWTLESTRNVP
jgi:cytoskeletal protein CcmA (bactofilin family)